MKLQIFTPILLLTLLLASCTIPQAAPTPTQVVIVIVPTFTPVQPTFTAPPSIASLIPTVIPTAMATALPSFCQDARVGTLLDSFGNALASSDGQALASLISPTNGVDVRFIRDGRVVNYDREHFKFVFESTFQTTWGLGAGSGEPVVGSFSQIVLPSLRAAFTSSSQRFCNQIKLGGATYAATWPGEYAAIDYYSVHFPGTDQYGGMDWQTWLAGVEYVNNQPYLRVLLHFAWEP